MSKAIQLLVNHKNNDDVLNVYIMMLQEKQAKIEARIKQVFQEEFGGEEFEAVITSCFGNFFRQATMDTIKEYCKSVLEAYEKKEFDDVSCEDAEMILETYGPTGDTAVVGEVHTILTMYHNDEICIGEALHQIEEFLPDLKEIVAR